MNLASFLLSWGIGTSIGLAMFPGSLIIYNYIQDKIMSRNFMDVVAENLGRDYQNNISNQARAEIEKEKGLTPLIFLFMEFRFIEQIFEKTSGKES